MDAIGGSEGDGKAARVEVGLSSLPSARLAPKLGVHGWGECVGAVQGAQQ